MTRKDYEKFVDVIKDHTIYQRSLNKYFNHYPLVNLFIGVFSADNHRFDRDKFRSAVDMAISKISHEGILIKPVDNIDDMEFQFRSPDLFRM